jgi:hypothetical protein
VERTPLFRPASPEYDDDEEEAYEDDSQVVEEPDYDEQEGSRIEEVEDDESADELAAALMNKVNISSSDSSSDPVASTSAAINNAPANLAPVESNASILFSVPGSLHLFDRGTSMFMLQEANVVTAIHQIQDGYWLVVEGPGGTWVSQGIDKDMVINFSEVRPVHLIRYLPLPRGILHSFLY